MKKILILSIALLALAGCKKEDTPQFTNSTDYILVSKEVKHVINNPDEYIFQLKYGYDPELLRLYDQYLLGVLTKEQYDEAVQLRKSDTNRKLEMRHGEASVTLEVYNKYNTGDVVDPKDLPRSGTIILPPL